MFKTQLKPCAAWGLSQSNIFGLLECKQCKIDVFASFFFTIAPKFNICFRSGEVSWTIACERRKQIRQSLRHFHVLLSGRTKAFNQWGWEITQLCWKYIWAAMGRTFECLFKSVVSQLTAECIVVFQAVFPSYLLLVTWSCWILWISAIILYQVWNWHGLNQDSRSFSYDVMATILVYKTMKWYPWGCIFGTPLPLNPLPLSTPATQANQ